MFERNRTFLAVKLYVHWTSAKLYVHWTSAIYSMPEFGSHWLLRCTNGQIRQSALVKVDQFFFIFLWRKNRIKAKTEGKNHFSCTQTEESVLFTWRFWIRSSPLLAQDKPYIIINIYTSVWAKRQWEMAIVCLHGHSYHFKTLLRRTNICYRYAPFGI